MNFFEFKDLHKKLNDIEFLLYKFDPKFDKGYLVKNNKEQGITLFLAFNKCYENSFNFICKKYGYDDFFSITEQCEVETGIFYEFFFYVQAINNYYEIYCLNRFLL